MTPVTVSVVVVVVVVVSSSEVVVSSVVVLLSSLLFLAQELTPSVRTDTRTRMSRKYLRKLKTVIS